MNRYATMVSALLMGALAVPAVHADNVTTYGAGLSPCRLYLHARDGSIVDEVGFIDWLGGYFSAVNRTSNHRNNFLGLADLKDVLARLDNNCRVRPELHVAEAANIVVLGSKP